MFPWTRHTLVSLVEPFLAPGEQVEVTVHLLAGSSRWRLRHFQPLSNPWEPSGTSEYAVLTDRQLLVLGADPGTGRPARDVRFTALRAGLTVSEVSDGSVRSIGLRDGDGISFRLFVPRAARREALRLVEVIGIPIR